MSIRRCIPVSPRRRAVKVSKKWPNGSKPWRVPRSRTPAVSPRASTASSSRPAAVAATQWGADPPNRRRPQASDGEVKTVTKVVLDEIQGLERYEQSREEIRRRIIDL